jgi:hypothetical protein
MRPKRYLRAESKQICHDCIPQSWVWTEILSSNGADSTTARYLVVPVAIELSVHDRWAGVPREPAMSPPAVDSDAVPALSHGGNRRVLTGWLRNPSLSDEPGRMALSLRPRTGGDAPAQNRRLMDQHIRLAYKLPQSWPERPAGSRAGLTRGMGPAVGATASNASRRAAVDSGSLLELFPWMCPPLGRQTQKELRSGSNPDGGPRSPTRS